jgi:hypothetical protein
VIDISTIPEPEPMPISVRAYAVASGAKGKSAEPPKAGKKKLPLAPSDWALVFDTETTTDASQALRFGTYQLRKSGDLNEAGIFYDRDGVTDNELTLLHRMAMERGQVLRTREEFVDEVFFKRAYQLRATIIGFNLPFDISRLAIKHGSARRAHGDEPSAMHGGFTFKLSEQKIFPNIRVKHLSRKAALISFAAPMGQRDSRGQRKRGMRNAVRRGHFIDVATLSNALLARGFSLAGLSKFLAAQNPKLDFDDFDGPITDEIVSYAIRDVQTTWECYQVVMARFNALKLSRSQPEKIYSEAGIGKGYIREMGIRAWRDCQPDFPAKIIARILGTYYGGRSEVRIRREIRQVMLCDFLSMYPTVCTLMGLWKFVIAEGMSWRDSTDATQAKLANVDLPDLQAKEQWAHLTTLVRVQALADVFPVRAAYHGEASSTIGANYLTSETPMWFTLADCIAAKLLTGKAPHIIEAMTFSAGAIQDGLAPICIAGNSDYAVDPKDTDFFQRVIELRQSIKGRMKSAIGDEHDRLDTEQHALKICANSTSYGIWVEINVEGRPEPLAVQVHCSTGEPFERLTEKAEMPGSYFHPLLATLITGAARLMLAITERLIADAGLDWAFCDTDSMAIAKPKAMHNDEFVQRVRSIVEWFAELNPYEFRGSILKIEDVNQSLETKQPEPLYCLAISSKRYALFNLMDLGPPIMRKVSAHGLGHLRPPYGDDDPPVGFPTPVASVLRDGTHRWHCDLWHQMVTSVLAGNPNQVRLGYHPQLSRPATSRYAATSPDLLRWFNLYNSGKPYRAQVKPFGFLLSMTVGWMPEGEGRIGNRGRGRPKKVSAAKPIAPFDRDHERAGEHAFDRESGAEVAASLLRSYADALAQYHLSPESKFLNSDYVDQGTTRRRHVKAISVLHIGKERNDWEQQAFLGLDMKQSIDYNAGTVASSLSPELLTLFTEVLGMKQTSQWLKIPYKKLSKISNPPLGTASRSERMT